jgi:hypothetical protein
VNELCRASDELFEANSREPEFRVGIDCGSAVDAAIGDSPRLFNLPPSELADWRNGHLSIP